MASDCLVFINWEKKRNTARLVLTGVDLVLACYVTLCQSLCCHSHSSGCYVQDVKQCLLR